ncbi:MAG TPA: TonB C-terminal domain-containing protein [Polyangiaceae bacterium]|jgi:hypothetical protein
MVASAFLPREWFTAAMFAAGIEIGLFAVLVTAGENRTHITPQETQAPEEMPIAVKPVLDDLPLLKLGSKKVKAKLPDMWTKQAPIQRMEEKSAPSAKAEKTPEAIPSAPVATRDAAAPPPDAEIAKVVDQPLPEAGAKTEPNLPTEGATDGVKNGTETDPLKARAQSLYSAKIYSWFQVRFHPPVGQIPCDVLHKLNASAQVTVGGDRVISGYTLATPSGNDVFDAKVKSMLDAMVGQELPPPPPLYPELTPGTLLRPTLSGSGVKCE